MFQSGLDLLDSFRGSSPFFDLLLRGVDEHVQRFGDGSKEVFLLFAALVRRLREFWQGSEQHDFRRRRLLLAQMESFRRKVLPELGRQISARLPFPPGEEGEEEEAGEEKTKLKSGR